MFARMMRRIRDDSPGPRRPSSVTDRDEFLDFCDRAATDDATFATFRRDPTIVGIFEHVSVEHGAAYLDVIKRDQPHLIKDGFDRFRTNDEFGAPVTASYPGIGEVSPVTLRYLKVVSDLETYFGVEIGVGYGGQARLLLERWDIRSYSLIDLGPVLRLAKRFLRDAGPYPAARFLEPDLVTARDFDLCISNYAFSELSREAQERYRRAIVARSAAGYMTCNFISDVHGVRSWSKAQLQRMRPDAHWVPEEPLTFEGNAVLLWGDAPLRKGLGAGARESYSDARRPR
jgi:hypothetical protein